MEFLLAVFRMGIVLTSLLILIVFLIGATRVWHESKRVKAVLQYAWEHGDKIASGGVMLGFILLIYKQPFIPAGIELSILINAMFTVRNLFELRGVVVGYARNLWTARGTKRAPIRDVTLQTQF
jgi:hypothetical protein